MAHSHQPAEQLTDPVLISILLEKALKKRSLLSIQLPDTDEEFLSIILELDEKGKYLYLDALKPDSGHLVLLNKKTFRANAKLQGISISFEGRLVKTKTDEDNTNYRVSFPQQLEYHEKRISHRVPIGRGLNTKANLLYAGDKKLLVRVADVSAEGVGLSLRANDAQRLLKAEQPMKCRINFMERENFDCYIELCHGHKNSDGPNVHLGAKFAGVTSHQRNQLLKIIRILERENIRKAAPD